MSDENKETQLLGTVKWYEPPIGYGFIKGDDGIEYFVCHSAIDMEGFRKLRHGQQVRFISNGKNHGHNHYVAKHVTVISNPKKRVKKTLKQPV